MRANLKNSLTIVAGTALAQGIPLAASPVLTRLYTVDDFALFGSYYAILMVLSSFLNGKFETALLLEKEENKLQTVVWLNILSTALLCAIVVLLGTAYATLVYFKVNIPEITGWWALPFSLFGLGLFQVGYYLNNRQESYSQMSKARIVRGTSTATGGIGLGLIKSLTSSGLIVADVLGQWMGTFLLLFNSKIWAQTLKTKPKLNELKAAFLAYRYFPYYQLPSGLLNKAGNYLPFFALGMISVPAVGLYTLAHRMVYAPTGIVASSFGDVFKQSAIKEIQHSGNCAKSFRQTAIYLFALAIVPFVLLQWFAPFLFTLIFGNEWNEAGLYAATLAPFFLAQFVVSPLSNVLLITNKQRLSFWLQVLLFILVMVSMTYGVLSGSAVILLQAFVAANLLKYFIEFFLSAYFAFKPVAVS